MDMRPFILWGAKPDTGDHRRTHPRRHAVLAPWSSTPPRAVAARTPGSSTRTASEDRDRRFAGERRASVMLSRVAENLYWLGRWIERAENTARIVGVDANLHLDLPRGIAAGLAAMTADHRRAQALYRERHTGFRRAQRGTLPGRRQHLPRARSCPLAGLCPRERTAPSGTVRPARGLGDRSTSSICTRCDNVQTGLSKPWPPRLPEARGQGRSGADGTCSGTMSHDDAYDFVRIGRNLERAEDG